MKLREPLIPDWLGNGLAMIVVVAASPVIAAMFCMAGAVLLKRKIMGPTKDWSRWFAWYPVRVDWYDTRWLEPVERRSFGIMQDTQYRAEKDKT